MKVVGTPGVTPDLLAAASASANFGPVGNIKASWTDLTLCSNILYTNIVPKIWSYSIPLPTRYSTQTLAQLISHSAAVWIVISECNTYIWKNDSSRNISRKVSMHAFNAKNVKFLGWFLSSKCFDDKFSSCCSISSLTKLGLPVLNMTLQGKAMLSGCGLCLALCPLWHPRVQYRMWSNSLHTA